MRPTPSTASSSGDCRKTTAAARRPRRSPPIDPDVEPAGGSLGRGAVRRPGDHEPRRRDRWPIATIDPQLRDEGAELLLDTAANALNGQSLAGLTLPQTARVIQWDWQPPTVPERRINCVFSYQYIDEGWDAYDTTP